MFLLISFEKITIKLFLYIKSQWKKKSALGLQRGSRNHQGRHSTFMNSYHKLPKLQKY